MSECKGKKFGIKIDKMFQGSWSLCVGISHAFGETYLYLNLLKVSISIGYMNDYLNDSI